MCNEDGVVKRATSVAMGECVHKYFAKSELPGDGHGVAAPTKDEDNSDYECNDSPEQSNGSSALYLEPQVASQSRRIIHKAGRFYHQNSFLILVTCAILLAYAYPPLGAIYVAPHITATWIAVIFIFILAGMGIRTEELTKALQRVYFNTFVQVFNFMVVSGIVYGFTRFMLHVNALSESLADGMTIASTLSVSVNMGIVLTKLVGGDEAAAIFDAAFGNFLGVFLSPALILMYLGLNAEVDLGQVTLKLFLRVVLPLFFGQLLRNFFPPAKAFVKKYNKYFRQGQEFCLVFVVYTIFCKTFLKGNDAKIGDVFIMIGCVLLVLLFLMVLAWISMLVIFPNDPKVQAVGLFACTHKTVAVGVPLISSIYADSPMLGLYVLPLLIWYVTQLVLGTALAPTVAKYVERREQELKQQLDAEAWVHGRGGSYQFLPYLTPEQLVVNVNCCAADEGFTEPTESQAIGTV